MRIMKFDNANKDPRQKFIGRKAKLSDSINGIVCGYSISHDIFIMALDKDAQFGWIKSIFEDYIDPKYKNNVYGYFYISKYHIL